MPGPKQIMTDAKIRVGITGQSGFIGSHIYNSFSLKDDIELVNFEKHYFTDSELLNHFVLNCDVIIHLAALNRHNDENILYDTNVQLINKLLDSCNQRKTKPHLIFASSTQEEKDNPYGRSKLAGRTLLEKWAKDFTASVTSLIIPNVFGPFGRPNYNSVVATFCHKLACNEEPKILIDNEINLIYVHDLVEEFYTVVRNTKLQSTPGIQIYTVPSHMTIKVSQILHRMSEIKSLYFNFGAFPNMNDPFTRDLFNTFLTYIDFENYFPVQLKNNTDERGNFVETVKLNSGGQVSFSTTKPGITRGNHFHIRKAERFAVVKGEAEITFRKIGTQQKFSFKLSGDKPAYVDMPVWYTHNITNTGNDELLTIFWINEHFDPDNPDTYFEKV